MAPDTKAGLTPAPPADSVASPAAVTAAAEDRSPYLVGWTLGSSLCVVVASILPVALGAADRGYFLLVFAFAVTLVASCFDVSTRRIPNALTYPAILLGLLVNALLPVLWNVTGLEAARIWTGTTGTVDALLGFGLCLVIGVVSFVARGLGGGDVKLVAALGILLGFAAMIPVLVNTLLAAGVIGIVNWALNGSLIARLQVVTGAVFANLALGRPLRDVYPFSRSEAPFGLALLIGLTSAQFIEIHRLVI